MATIKPPKPTGAERAKAAFAKGFSVVHNGEKYLPSQEDELLALLAEEGGDKADKPAADAPADTLSIAEHNRIAEHMNAAISELESEIDRLQRENAELKAAKEAESAAKPGKDADKPKA